MKAFDPEDPFTPVGVGLDKDPDEEAFSDMAWAVVEEYVRMGWNGDQIRRLFHNPFFQMAHQILRVKGEPFIEELADKADLMRSQVRQRLEGTS
jgi:calcineurin-like phosphoesterase family protein